MSVTRIQVGILAVQGDVDAHAQALERLGAGVRHVLREKDLDAVDALILPGGESTTIAKGLQRLGLYEPVEAFAHAGRPLLGTCAGAVLLAREVECHPVRSLGVLDVVAVRNAYGTQVDSFATRVEESAEGFADLRCVFIRAPRLRDPGPEVRCSPVWGVGRSWCGKATCLPAPSTRNSPETAGSSSYCWISPAARSPAERTGQPAREAWSRYPGRGQRSAN